MPFVALDIRTKTRIDLSLIEDDPRTIFADVDLVCPRCDETVIVRSAHWRNGTSWIVAHFVHKIGDCQSNYDAHPESYEHLYAKMAVREEIIKQSDSNSTQITVDLEVPIDMDWRDRGRIADVLVTFVTGRQIAHEVQLSPITVDELRARTNDYHKAGIDVAWWINYKHLTPNIRAWAIEDSGICRSIQVELKYDDINRRYKSRKASPRSDSKL